MISGGQQGSGLTLGPNPENKNKTITKNRTAFPATQATSTLANSLTLFYLIFLISEGVENMFKNVGICLQTFGVNHRDMF